MPSLDDLSWPGLTRPFRNFLSCLLVRIGSRFNRQRNVELRPGIDTRRRRKLAPVPFNDHSTYRQTHSHSVFLRGDECVEYLAQVFGLYSRA